MERMFNIQEVADRVGMSAKTIRRWVKQGEFPGPVLKRPRVHRWSAGQLGRWLATAERKARLSAR